MDFINYSYKASVYGFTTTWEEGTGYFIGDTDDGSTYLKSKPGISWPAGFPNTSIDISSRLDVSFQGIRGQQSEHAFPISGEILQGLKNGTYTAIAIIETGAEYNNVDFSSSQGHQGPELHLF
jgi:hypothetical protein